MRPESGIRTERHNHRTINQNSNEGRMKNYNKIISLVIPQRPGIKIKSSARNDDEWLLRSLGRPKWPPVAEAFSSGHDKTGNLSALQSLFNKHNKRRKNKIKISFFVIFFYAESFHVYLNKLRNKLRN